MPLTPKPSLSPLSTASLPISGEILVELIQEVLATGADFRFTARGVSMLPFIKDGDTVTITPASREKPAIGKVVAYLQPVNGRLIIHRMVGQRGSTCLIQGDNTLRHAFDLVEASAILGCVTRLERNGRRRWLGLGPERYLVALFSRQGWLTWLGWRWHRLRRWLPRK